MQHDGEEDYDLHVRLVGGCRRAQRDSIRRCVYDQPERGCPRDSSPLPAAAATSATLLAVGPAAAADGDLVDDQHEDEAQDEGHADDVRDGVLLVTVAGLCERNKPTMRHGSRVAHITIN